MRLRARQTKKREASSGGRVPSHEAYRPGLRRGSRLLPSFQPVRCWTPLNFCVRRIISGGQDKQATYLSLHGVIEKNLENTCRKIVQHQIKRRNCFSRLYHYCQEYILGTVCACQLMNRHCLVITHASRSIYFSCRYAPASPCKVWDVYNFCESSF